MWLPSFTCYPCAIFPLVSFSSCNALCQWLYYMSWWCYYNTSVTNIWSAPWQNQYCTFATSIDPDQHVHPRSLIRIHAVHLQTFLQVEKLIANSMDPDQTAWMSRLVWNHAGRKPIMLVLSWHGSYIKTGDFWSSEYITD
jgi:hypothetical protein